MSHLLFSLNAVMPIILLVFLGYFLKVKKLMPLEFFTAANKLCFYLLLPAMLFYNIYEIDSFTQIDWGFLAFIATAITVWFILGFIYVKIFIDEDRQKAVVHSGIFRSNFAIIGIPLAIAIAGTDSQAVMLASLVVAVNVPLVNTFSVLTMTYFSNGQNKSSKLDTLKKVLLNPLIVSVMIALVITSVRIFIIQGVFNSSFTIKSDISFLYTAMRNLTQAATPVALLSLGGKFSFGSIGPLKVKIFSTVFIRAFMVPFVTLGVAYFIGFGHNQFPALIALFATPVSISSVPMAQQMGADDELMGQIVVWTTIASAFSLFGLITLTSMLGIL